MDFEIPEECFLVRNMVKEFVRQELEPIANDIDERDKIPEDIIRKMKSLGFFGMTIPEAIEA
jgi:acyl-CoA dehydrogenase